MTAPGDALDVLCFGGEDWWYHNRGHVDMQLMRHMAARGRVLYVNSVVMRKFNFGEGAMFLTRLIRKAKSIGRGVVRVDENFFVYSPVTLPVHHVPVARRLNQAGLYLQARFASARAHLARPIVWVACPAACEAALRLPRQALVYQRTDRYEEFPGVDAGRIREMDIVLKREADVTFFVNTALFEEERSQCRFAYLLDHGVDYDHFANADGTLGVPAEMQGLKSPIVGFFGGIDDHTFDVALAAQVAGECPEMTFVFVGSVSADVTALEALSNVRLIGKRPYQEIPHYGRCFDVAIMPWRQNRWIEACNPVKLKEYLALGKPVISTPFRELENYQGLVYVAKGPQEFAAALGRALAEDSAERRRLRRARVREHSWDAKAREAIEAILLPRHAPRGGIRGGE
ncbi:MAG: glycosyltransferase [Planctomycetes bacterium]|nr:glycosyltransferase [Planctomycetota bacterium]